MGFFVITTSTIKHKAVFTVKRYIRTYHNYIHDYSTNFSVSLSFEC